MHASLTTPAGPLAGMRVIEVSSFVAAPLGGMTLAQLGAEVIRVDPAGGGPDIRRWPVTHEQTSLYWAGLNKGKKSVTMDFRSPQARETLRALICDAGIVLTNAVGRDWLSYESLAPARPDLIHVQVEGKHDGSPAVDYTVSNAETKQRIGCRSDEWVDEAGELSPGPSVSTDEEILDWVGRDGETALHPSCTCAMGTGAMSVVDPTNMRVHGLEGLRVVDASAMPYVTNGNIYAPVMMMAEKAADLILENTPLEPLNVEFYRHQPKTAAAGE